ncbi:MAG: pilin [Thiomargarita sp.]|nr:pilin [Thiomargarita sp.]
MHTKKRGFSLIELMIVIAIMGILAAMSFPNYPNYVKRAKVSEAFRLAPIFTQKIAEYYAYYGKFPKTTQATHLSDKIKGEYIQSMQIENGAIHITFDRTLNHAILTLRPALIISVTPTQTLLWVCGYATPIQGTTVIGHNKTDIKPEYLPANCL